MNCGSRLSAPPHNGSECAQVKFGPYSRDRDQHAFPWRATHDALSGVGEKSGGQVNQGETHLVHGCSEVPASHSVRCFMNGSENKRDCPEGGEVQPCLVGEIEKLHRVTAYLAPVQHKDGEGYSKCTQRQESEPPRKDESNLTVQPYQELVGIERRKLDEPQVGPFAFLLKSVSPFLGRLHQTGNVFFLRRLIPEFGCLQAVCDFMQFILRNWSPSLLEIGFRNLFVASLAIEKTHQIPSLRGQSKKCIDTGHVYSHGRAAVNDVLLVNDLRMQAWAALRDQTCRDLRQNDIQRLGEVHGCVSMRRSALIPGRKRPTAPVTSTRPSKVPLVGSTTGLSSTTLAVCGSVGKSGIVRESCWPCLRVSRYFSGSVKRMRKGASAVTQNNRSPLATCWPSRT